MHFLRGVTPAISAGRALQSAKARLTARGDIWTLGQCWEPLLGAPCFIRLSTLKAMEPASWGLNAALSFWIVIHQYLGTETNWVKYLLQLFFGRRRWEVQSTWSREEWKCAKGQRVWLTTWSFLWELWDGSSHLLQDLPSFACILFPFLPLVVSSFVALFAPYYGLWTCCSKRNVNWIDKDRLFISSQDLNTIEEKWGSWADQAIFCPCSPR